MPEFPAVMPGPTPAIPIEIRRFLTAKLLERQLELCEGWVGLVKDLYGGQVRPDGQRLSYVADGRSFWQYVVADTDAWLLERAKEQQEQAAERAQVGQGAGSRNSHRR
jgi:hypothetical protein